MILDKPVEGKNILLRSVEVTDAEFILPLRLDPQLNQHLNAVSPSVENQRNWIVEQQKRPLDYYFIIHDKKTKRDVGTVGLYEIDPDKGTFNWGRWIIVKDAPMYTAVESTILIYDTAFNHLGLKEALSEVRLANYKVINFHLSYGSVIYKLDELNAYYSFSKDTFGVLLKKFRGFHTLKF